MMNRQYALGLDVGERRIGVALASLAARLPAPLTWIDRQKRPDSIQAIKEIIEREDVGVAVVGLPRGLSGQETAQTAEARAFASSLSEAISIPVVMQDEAGTSAEAEERLRQRGKPYNKGDIDAEAATIILRDYLQQYVENTA